MGSYTVIWRRPNPDRFKLTVEAESREEAIDKALQALHPEAILCQVLENKQVKNG